LTVRLPTKRTVHKDGRLIMIKPAYGSAELKACLGGWPSTIERPRQAALTDLSENWAAR